MSQSIQPLRINKGTPSSSPSKMSGQPTQRPLAEIHPTERRRNSPSFNQSTKKNLIDSSPFDSSPFASKFNLSSFGNNSPLAYWQSRDSPSPTRSNAENRDPRDESPGPAKRSSIENLKRASRVKNSSMFAREQKHEYDPTSVPVVERPLAAGRPLVASNFASNANSEAGPQEPEEARGLASPAKFSPKEAAETEQAAVSPSRGQTSPGKSSLSRSSRYGLSFGPDATGLFEDESFADCELPAGKSLRRHAKSVTFDVAPPQINEYEMTTPDPSSVASGSREGSYESIEDEDEDEDEDHLEHSVASREDSFDASLEDTDKTPVVLPEDWRFMSPSTANDKLAAKEDDPFDGRGSSPAPNAVPQLADLRFSPTRTDSLGSNGERRPLPPLPDLAPPSFPRSRSNSNSSLQAAGERASLAQNSSPSPPRPASLSKSEIQGLTGPTMSLEDRLRLMMIQEEEKTQAKKSANEEQRERRMRRAAASPDRVFDSNKEIKIHEDEPETDDVAALGDFKLPRKINRESILKKVKSQIFNEFDDYSSPAPDSSPVEPRMSLPLDPDVPIPSLEDRAQPAVADDGVFIKPEPEENEVDVYAIPGMYRDQDLGSKSANSSFESAVEHTQEAPVIKQEDDDESLYSRDLADEPTSFAPYAEENDNVPTPRAASPASLQKAKIDLSEKRMSLSQFASLLGQDDFASSFSNYMTPSPPDDEPLKAKSSAVPAPLQQAHTERPLTPVHLTRPVTSSSADTSNEDPQTPESVIRHRVSGESVNQEPAVPEPVPEPVATIKAPGGSLKTRPSLAPADLQTMAETRRKVSGEKPPVPAIPERHLQRPSTIPEADSPRPSSADMLDETRSGKRKSSLIPLDIPVNEIDEGLSIGLDKEFDRVIEAQKVAFDSFFQQSHATTFSYDPHNYCDSSHVNTDPQKSAWYTQNLANINVRRQKGYLMRQNTKMVVASSASHESASTDSTDAPAPAAAHHPRASRATRSAGNSPVKQSQAGAWTTEPWNGKIRRKSIRQSAGSPMKPPSFSSAVPPLPGMQSNVAAADSEILPEADETEDGKERGRLFVKVVGVKDLDLPLPRGERSYFCLTLDNGLHCVTTAWLELGRCAPIGQEFELVVLNDLEFQLTLQTKIEEPKAPKAAPASPTKAKAQKPSTFSRVFTSPKKRRELELKQQEEERKAAKQKQAEAEASKKQAPTAWDLLHNLVGKDGSFARSYIALKEHESQAYGRPCIVDIPCFNEWTMEESRTLTSAKSGRSGTGPGVQRKAPYKIGKLELQLLYVPKPSEATDDDMPKSMNSCVRELQEAERTAKQVYEGHLSQQGGDCPYWRRRFFRLEGPKLTAYHEATRQPRATINLGKASKLIDDKSTLTQKEFPGKGGARRRSAFAAEEEGYMFVEEGFRLRFANGEVIDFYADSAGDKATWMRALSEVVGREAKVTRSWTGLVLARERQLTSRAARHQPQPPSQPQPQQQPAQQQANSFSTKSAPGTPATALKHHAPPAPQRAAVENTGSPKKSSFSRPLSHQQYHQQHQQLQRQGGPPPVAGQRPNSSDKPLPPRGRDSGAGMMARHQKTRSMLF